MLWRLNELALLLTILVVFLIATEVGFRLGQRHADWSDEFDKAHVNSLQGAVISLLALLLGFTFFMAVTRFDERKSLVLEEANSIGTTMLRAQFLTPEQAGTAKHLLRAHVTARLAFYAAGVDPVRLEKANTEAADTERRLWSLALAAAAQDPRSVPTGLFVEALNGVIDVHEKRQVAFDNHVPEPVLYLLLVVSVVFFTLLGHGCGLKRRRKLGSNSLFAVLIAFVLMMILDIDRPRRGFITVPQQSLIRLQASFEHEAN